MELIKQYGEGIVKALVEAYDPRYLKDLEDIKIRSQGTHQHFPPQPQFVMQPSSMPR